MNASTIDDAEMCRLHLSGATQTATAIARKVARATHRLSHNEVLALALHLHPDHPPADALARLDATVDDFIRTFGAASREFCDALAGDRERKAPIVTQAARRRHEVANEIVAIDSSLAAIERNDATKRERLKSAGLSGAQLHRAAVPTDTTELSARRAAMVVESEALDRFLRTRDEDELPAAFVENVAA